MLVLQSLFVYWKARKNYPIWLPVHPSLFIFTQLPCIKLNYPSIKINGLCWLWPISKERLLQCLRQSSLCWGSFVPKARCPHCQKHKPYWTFFASFYQRGMLVLNYLLRLRSHFVFGIFSLQKYLGTEAKSLLTSLCLAIQVSRPRCLFSLAHLSFCGSVLYLHVFKQPVKNPEAALHLWLTAAQDVQMLQLSASPEGICCSAHLSQQQHLC